MKELKDESRFLLIVGLFLQSEEVTTVVSSTEQKGRFFNRMKERRERDVLPMNERAVSSTES